MVNGTVVNVLHRCSNSGAPEHQCGGLVYVAKMLVADENAQFPRHCYYMTEHNPKCPLCGAMGYPVDKDADKVKKDG